MALKILVTVSKKIPGPQDFSSVQASCTVEGELVGGQDAAHEAARLFAQAEQAVDYQLNNAPGTSVAPAAPSSSAGPNNGVRSWPSQPAAPSPRRAPAPSTESQLRLLRRLLDARPGHLDALLRQYQLRAITDLTCKQASEVIDGLKAGAA